MQKDGMPVQSKDTSGAHPEKESTRAWKKSTEITKNLKG